jgi:hypothetical protein
MVFSLSQVTQNYSANQKKLETKIACEIDNGIMNQWYPGCPSITLCVGWEDENCPPLALPRMIGIVSEFAKEGWIISYESLNYDGKLFFEVKVTRKD